MNTAIINERQIKEVISEVLRVDVELIQSASHFIDDLGAESLTMIELMMVLEEEFDIEIPDDKADELDTVEKVILHIEQQLL
jgi:acyl carrier protein